jgi:hypothetical protein
MPMKPDKEVKTMLGLDIWRAEDPLDFVGWDVVLVDIVNSELPDVHPKQEYIVHAQRKGDSKVIRTVICNAYSFPVASLEGS